ncbi:MULTISPECIES: malate:quinone oxidoreductase [unclassified Cryobacterium]|uniref:malate:quinone oxidoreductase n=1 Tax=unclassified Cryobacterium TaxID=2649013 RepID=UPI002AB50772|nr:MULTISPECIES: malate:quinone oxidoreductase [unclassified Cryobacterium]MDY7529141.1 malate:quinone oxidoreductase [Cryobacterium sp. 10C2]MDY7558697.1 malate:quinone oxidoreductase [Cryobacterium sp. 10C3]MEB0201903.1 malate:quinone oxidoreductase [Cryobacterium sp. 5I3]MEB0290583.1 malate:quinone oxidoreductase [Cryobacterium sp. 10C2]
MAQVDVVLIGGGVMSATLGTLIKQVQPDWSIEVYERLGEVAQESSNPWNNAGTGHAALCELNYMPQASDGSVTADKAVSINEQFQISRQLWSSLVIDGVLPEPTKFINSTPHMTFVHGKSNVEYLRKRFAALKDQPLFHGMEYSEDPAVIGTWTPLLTKNRPKNQRIAATRIASGTDVDFGALTRYLFDDLAAKGVGVHVNQQVTGLKKLTDGTWRLNLRRLVGGHPSTVKARFVFVGAGGGALALLQQSGIPEARGFGGFPISGQFLRTTNPAVVAQHQAKVYGKAAVGAPPMSVPHLDTRHVEGEASLLFGPFAGFTPKFLKSSTWFDLPFSVRGHNIGPMLAVARHNVGLMKYLFGEVFASRTVKLKALQEFMPTAKMADWELITAGQRVQVMKKDPKEGGVLQFGTEVITSADGSIAGLLGASPGASTAAPIMVDLLKRCFPEQYPAWEPRLRELIPSLGTTLSDDPARAAASLAATAATLHLTNP